MKKIYRYVVSAFALMICLVLSVLIARYNCYMNDLWASYHEITIFERDNVWIHIICLLVFVAVLVFLNRVFVKVRLNNMAYKVIHYTLLAVIGALGVIWVSSMHATPKADQLYIQQSLEAMINGDYTPFMKAGYISICPHQTGYMWISFVVAKIFGLNNYPALQIMNVISLVLFYEGLTRISDLLGFGRKTELMILVTGLLFYPLTMYTTFVYGNIPGLALSTWAVVYAYKFGHNNKIKYIVFSSICMLGAIVFKKNYVVSAMGLMIWFFVKACSEKTKKNWIAIIIVAAGVILGIKGPVMLTEKVTGCKLDSGMSSFSYIAMGLQEGERAPGWYNEYVKDVAYQCDYNSDEQALVAKDNIKESVNRFLASPAYTLGFFLNKTISQWSNPTFQCVWANQFVGDTEKQPLWVQRTVEYENELIHVKIMSLIDFLISIGALIYIPLFWKEKKYEESLLLLMILIGGFIFHTFWEGKSQYVLTYFVLLIPYSCAGFNRLAERLGKKKYEQESTDNT